MSMYFFAACIVPSSPILVTAMMEVLQSSDISVLTGAPRHKIPEDGIFQVKKCVLYVYIYIVVGTF
jgi:hypothetical protein